MLGLVWYFSEKYDSVEYIESDELGFWVNMNPECLKVELENSDDKHQTISG